MEKICFADYHGIGDIIGHSKGGYFYDSTTTAQTINCLRCKQAALNDQHKPAPPLTSLTHDVMFIDTDKEGEKVQWCGELDQDDNTSRAHAAGKHFTVRWPNYPLPANRHQSFNEQEDRRRILNTRRRALRWKGSFLMKIVAGVNCLTTISIRCIRDCDT